MHCSCWFSQPCASWHHKWVFPCVNTNVDTVMNLICQMVMLIQMRIVIILMPHWQRVSACCIPSSRFLCLKTKLFSMQAYSYLVVLSTVHNSKDFSYNHVVAVVGPNCLLDVRCNQGWSQTQESASCNSSSFWQVKWWCCRYLSICLLQGFCCASFLMLMVQNSELCISTGLGFRVSSTY